MAGAEEGFSASHEWRSVLSVAPVIALCVDGEGKHAS